jgi:hypothetical protein
MLWKNQPVGKAELIGRRRAGFLSHRLILSLTMGSSLWQANLLESIQNEAGRLVVTGNSKKYRQRVVV